MADGKFTFIELFAGIGGFRIGLERLGGKCVFASEWDKHSQKTHAAWFGDIPTGDIRTITPSDIPDHTILTAGFPCQPFSIAGVSKRNSLGRLHGFEDKVQGNLFFNITAIIKAKRPAVVLLENVKNLKSHDRGNTWKVIEQSLSDLGYTVFNKIIDAKFWVPQHRERVFIVAFDKRKFGDTVKFEFPGVPGYIPKLKGILESDVAPRYTLSPKLWNYMQEHARKQAHNGNGFGYGLADLNSHSRTLTARYYKDGAEILIPQGDIMPP